ncbi:MULTISPECIES: type II secretion system minor pseudopilin GspK [Idiomarina]|uniref:type II secretion system minor pseudopilin GspK n=1 Tax=Idiomarina TaxID=135575 RepID=UPI00129C99B9|nr:MULTISPECIES: type II secretion system minor pseudopilin GspK [Idiomarina]MRJ42555.1 type II secretory pathway protein [Idiomarina sp. FeN1]NCU58168.1 type II secretory pathway protein [Idiomarina sp. FenA--70]NCU60866.1 type II secretory pathway protein [Idiomarina sp. FenBw--71]UUN12764.1 type II secretion system minor pseudopilin GspK [Idiomarina loihiensis]
MVRAVRAQLPSRQRGVALLMVLLVVALVSVLAISLSGRLQTSVLRTGNLQQAEQAYWYSLSAEEVVRELLQRELADSEGIASQDQVWYQQSQNGVAFPVVGGSIAGRIKDLHSCFNLNSLRMVTSNDNNNPGGIDGSALDEATKMRLVRRKAQLRMLLMAIDDSMEAYAVDVIVDSLADWLDPDDDIGTGGSGTYGAETSDYQSQQFPHNAGNTWLNHISEFRLVRGVTAPLYHKIKPYVCVIPRDNSLKINLNTVSSEQANLLHAVSLGALSLEDAKSFINNRPQAGYESVEDAKGNGVLNNAAQGQIRPNLGGGPRDPSVTNEVLGGALEDFDVKSKYFEVHSRITVGDLEIDAHSQLLITNEQTQVLYRGLGEP